MKHQVTRALACGVLLAVAGCGGASSSPATDAADASAAGVSGAPAESSAPAKASGCVELTAAWAQAIADGAQDGTGGITITKVAGYRSTEAPAWWLIAARFEAEGIDAQDGVWASTGKEPAQGLLVSVDQLAHQFTVWPFAQDTQAGLSSRGDDVDAAKACLG